MFKRSRASNSSAPARSASSGFTSACLTSPRLARFPPKWLPVRRKKTRQFKNLERAPDSKKSDRALVLQHGPAFVTDEQIMHVVCVLLLDDQYAFQHDARSGIVVPEVTDQFAIMINGNPLGDQVLLDHVNEVRPFRILGNRASS